MPHPHNQIPTLIRPKIQYLLPLANLADTISLGGSEMREWMARDKVFGGGPVHYRDLALFRDACI